jgi:hypothetical protein
MAQSIDLLKQLQTAVLRHNQKRHFNSFLKPFRTKNILKQIVFGVIFALALLLYFVQPFSFKICDTGTNYFKENYVCILAVFASCESQFSENGKIDR